MSTAKPAWTGRYPKLKSADEREKENDDLRKALWDSTRVLAREGLPLPAEERREIIERFVVVVFLF